MEFTPDQLEKLKLLGVDIDLKATQQKASDTPPETPIYSPIITQSKTQKISPVVPLLSISGITLLSFGGLILFKSKNTSTVTPSTNLSPANSSQQAPSPTQVPKSIQHYLLTSQQYFSSALQNQNSTADSQGQQSVVNLLNQSILAATEAIKSFPNDSRGYYQRGKIYQSLLDSKPELLTQAISDVSAAQKLNPSSAEVTRDLASLYARKGDAQNTIIYLSAAVSLDPTQAQNFYDLAKIQQQAGLLPQALETYNKLLTLLTDINQKSQVETEKTAIEKIIADNPNLKKSQSSVSPTQEPVVTPGLNLEGPTIQALADNNLIIAAPETSKDIQVKNQTDSNSLSGTGTLPAGQSSITITNSQLTSTSQVYVTITKGGKNQTLKVISKSTDSFVVGLDTAINEDIEFKWWIIN